MNVYEYFLGTAKKYPDKTAVSAEDGSLTFCQLAEKAEEYGTMIAAQGQLCRPVGVFADRSVRALAGFLAVIWSGNFYVPLDPQLPEEKLRQIARDSEMQILLDTEQNGENRKLSDFTGTRICLNLQKNVSSRDPASRKKTAGTGTEKEEEQRPSCLRAEPWRKIGDDAPLYMIYTSGSTGKPKGVLKSHGAVISFLEAYCGTFDFKEDDILANQTPFSFDASAKDIYLTLKTGITMEIVPTGLFLTPPLLVDYLKERKVTFLSWVPTALSVMAMLDQETLGSIDTLRKIFFIGEVMPVKYLNKLRSALPQVQFVNLYGQSEIAGVCCYYEVKKTFGNASAIPMGHPLSNCGIHLMDDTMKEIRQPGVIGEIWLVSDALALEYYHDPEKTAACFQNHDFGDGLVRCFRTGDLAQYDENGDLIFASRNDFQIKHMGHRIELGEIEAIAGALPEIERCACLYHPERRKIILFSQLTEGACLSGREILLKLQEKLVKYMMPSKVHILETMPVNANGKTDRKELKRLM